MEIQKNVGTFEQENVLTLSLTKKASLGERSKTSNSTRGVRQVKTEDPKAPVSALKGRVTLYADQQKTLKRLKKPIEKSGSLSSAGRYHLEMNHILEFFEGERNRLDEIWCESLEQSPKDLPRDAAKLSENLSTVLQQLYAQGLEKSIEIDLKLENHHEESFMEDPTFNTRFFSQSQDCEAEIWKDLRGYYLILESLLKKCTEYRSLTASPQKTGFSGVDLK